MQGTIADVPGILVGNADDANADRVPAYGLLDATIGVNRRFCAKEGMGFFPVSALTGEGIDDLVAAIFELLQQQEHKGKKG